MRFIFLGTGTSAGVPAIGCDCAVCSSTDPRDRRLRTSAAVEWTDPSGHERRVIIDTGPDLREQALRHRFRRLDAVLFTHNHVDHTFGLDEVRRFNAVQRTPIDVYAEPHTLEHLRRVYAHIFDRQRNVNDSFVADLRAHEIGMDRSISLYGMRFTPVRLEHGRLPIAGFRIEPEEGRAAAPFPLAYCTDVSAIPEESFGRLSGLSTLVLDALRHKPHPTHLTLADALALSERIGAGRTYFVHMAHDLPHAETQASLPAGVFLAHDGLVLGGREDEVE